MSSLRSYRRGSQGAVLALGLLLLCLWNTNPKVDTSETASYISSSSLVSRHLLSRKENCTPAAVEQFPNDGFSMVQRRQGAIAVHIFAALYTFWGLAIACDNYFVPSLEKISDVLQLQEDVAGATLMAAGSSAPELATAVIGVFIAQDDIGLGAVVGSAVFNIMFVIGLCAICAGTIVYLHWWPLFRDCLCYLISIVALTAIIYDDLVQWYEGLILLVLYVLYIVLMFFNPRIEKWMVEKCQICFKHEKNEFSHLVRFQAKKHTVGGDSSNEKPEENVKDTEKIVKDVDSESVLTFPKTCCKRIIWLLSLPLTIVMFVTVPDCRRRRWEKCYAVTFILSLLWISAFSYVMVWMITILGFTLGIPDTALAMTFVAAGVSVPDAIASIIVLKDGYGDMAVSNAVGSNVFDILLCLGLPWTLMTIIKQGAPVAVYSEGLTYASLTLLFTVVFLLVATHVNGWKLTRRYGFVLVTFYFIITTISCLFELNIFGEFHLPACVSSY